MRADDAAVAGFFEDIPVLLFVLGGVAVLVSSGTWASVRIAENREELELQGLAESSIGRLIDRIHSLSATEGIPQLGAIEKSNISEYMAELLSQLHFLVNLSIAGNVEAWSLLLADGGAGTPKATGHSRAWFTAQSSTGIVVVCEVRLVVWRA